MENLKFEYNYNIPKLSNKDIFIHTAKAIKSKRKRSPLILHKKGDQFNQVFNFICENSYMRPHLHPKQKMVEKMHLITGSFKLFFFNNHGKVIELYELSKPGQRVKVPENTWHTYVMTSKLSIIFETMMGVYNKSTWKKMAEWAPDEHSNDAQNFLKNLKKINY